MGDGAASLGGFYAHQSLCLSILHVCLSHGDTVYRQRVVQSNNGEQSLQPPFFSSLTRIGANCSHRFVFVDRSKQMKRSLQDGAAVVKRKRGVLHKRNAEAED